MKASGFTHDQSVRIYTGPGSSNSWIWLADFLEREGFLRAIFCAGPNSFTDIGEGSIAVLPGGDAFRIASSLGEDGLDELASRIAKGANYVGICAGAYLPLRTSVPPLSSFNLLSSKVANLSSEIPREIAEPAKYSVPYGCSFVYHPFRGPAKLKGRAELTAPLYGGPILSESDEDEAILRFAGFEKSTEYILDRARVEELVMGKAACVEGRHGKGRVIAMSPHLEHPDYPDANKFLASMLSGFSASEPSLTESDIELVDAKLLRSLAADLKVLASTLETRSWKVGIKYWESDKLLFFIDAVGRRLRSSKDLFRKGVPADALESFSKAKSDLQSLVSTDDERSLRSAVESLSAGASAFLNHHFSRLEQQLPE